MSQDKIPPHVDAVQKIAEQEQSRTQQNEPRGAATLDQHSGRFGINLKKLMIPVIIVLTGLVALMFYYHYKTLREPTKAITNHIVRNTLPPYKKSKVKPDSVDDVEKTTNSQMSTELNHQETHTEDKPDKESPVEVLRKRRLTAALCASNPQKGQSSSHPTAQSSTYQEEGVVHLQGTTHVDVNDQTVSSSSLGTQLQPLQLKPAFAGQLGDRNYLLTQGAVLDCVLETRLITTQPGLCMCTLTRDVYSANGRVILLDRGSKVVGHYQGNLNQGQARIFVLWTRIETPKGVIINLDSPGAGSLGEGGLGGYIDNHFWQRFGSAIMLSLIDDLSEFAANQNQKSDKSQVNLNNTSGSAQDMAAEALKNSINIPPTLYKNQGERITVFVARDLDFRGVYDLQLTP